ncbi:helix-turn-helix domain-containing protein [Erwinia sp. B116]|uniref:helix-turn-helix domain-containing protein n=1 Tax=Erwinia sp. B116 TaxID=1561024 RepID=UPI001E2B7164|nr:helix-turn-helix domain-containing protein [Erwinia sp. B116]
MKEITGLSPHQFIRKQRLLAARVWLRSGEASITDIAFRCGFSSSNHFSSSYKNLFGYAPSQEPLQP